MGQRHGKYHAVFSSTGVLLAIKSCATPLSARSVMLKGNELLSTVLVVFLAKEKCGAAAPKKLAIKFM